MSLARWGEAEPPDWVWIYRLLIHGKPRLKIQEIECLTDTELALYLDQNLEEEGRPAAWAHAGGKGEAGLEAAEMARMAAWERTTADAIRLAYEGWE